jgi:hypothetical protein
MRNRAIASSNPSDEAFLLSKLHADSAGQARYG